MGVLGVAEVIIPVVIFCVFAIVNEFAKADERVREISAQLHRQGENAKVVARWVTEHTGRIDLLEREVDDAEGDILIPDSETIGADFHVISEQVAELGSLAYAVSNNLRVVANRFQGRDGDAFPGDDDYGPEDGTVNQASGHRCCSRENG